uniref:M20 aminoacylase family protein n=1 Tax=Marinobacterium profundum TaxID=1714300 RepID=UPI000830EC48|nr:M20 aminoacylase family protein [Marinobacterium profundum]
MTRLIENPDFLLSCAEFVRIRQDIHAHPELGAEVPRTSALVARLLQDWGYETHTGIGGQGVVGVLRNGTGSRSIGLRADMDALPMQERTGLPHASTIDGRMHACGHDGHTAILLAAAHYLAHNRHFDGTLNLIFQPDEEGLSGAKVMIEDGLFERFPCDAVYALHNMPGKEVGHGIARAGVFMASSDRVEIRLQGKGGHAALPHLSIDPTPALASIVLALQTIISRNLDPMEAAVLSIGKLEAGTASNVIPDQASLTLSVRALTPESRELLEKRICEIVQGQCSAYGIDAHIEYHRLVPPLQNSAAQTQLMHDCLSDVLGADFVAGNEAQPLMGSEDFAWMLQERPGCYFLLANGTGEWVGCSVHNPHYDFNDRLVPLGAACWVELVNRYLC